VRDARDAPGDGVKMEQRPGRISSPRMGAIWQAKRPAPFLTAAWNTRRSLLAMMWGWYGIGSDPPCPPFLREGFCGAVVREALARLLGLESPWR